MKIEGCTCETEEIEWHPCPYAEDINDDHETMCKCCDTCEHECLQDI